MRFPRRPKQGSEDTPEARERRRAERAARAEKLAAKAEQRAARAEAHAASSSAKAKRGAAKDAAKLRATATTVLTELIKLGRELLVIPAQLWIAVAEVAGAVVLAGWRRGVRPALIAALAVAGAALRLAERYLTPARAVVAVALVALVALAISQWLDYRSVSVGNDAYSGDIQVVVPAPEVETAAAGEAHGWAMLPLAAAGLAALGFGVVRRPGAARLLIVVGIVAIAISVIVDAPKGLDEGEAAVAYEGASASLLEGFWLQIVAGSVLIACGLMLPAYLRPAPARTAPSRPDAVIERLIDRARAGARGGVARGRRGAARGLERARKLPPASRGKRKVQGAGT